MKMLLFLFFVVDIIKHRQRCTNTTPAKPQEQKRKRQKSREAKRRVATRFLPSLSVVKVGHCEMTAPNQPGAQSVRAGRSLSGLGSETATAAGGGLCTVVPSLSGPRLCVLGAGALLCI